MWPSSSQQTNIFSQLHSFYGVYMEHSENFFTTNLYVYKVYNWLLNIHVTLLLISDSSSLNERSEHFFYLIIQSILLVKIYF
jgi:hypothetical protein